MDKIFYAISTICSPLLIPTYAMILIMQLTVLNFLPAATQWATIGMIFFITAVIPAGAILILHRIGVVSNPSLSERSERTAPYAICCVCYIGAWFYLMKVHAPFWLWLFMVGAFIALLINAIVTRWWKISAHMTAMGGVVALLFRLQASGLEIHDMTLWLAGSIALTGLVGSARIYRERHTLMQVFAGAVCGFVSVFFITMITHG